MKKKISSTVRELAYYSSLGLSVALAIFIGLFMGLWLDRIFGTSPVLMLIFLGLGIAAGFTNILKAAKRSKRL